MKNLNSISKNTSEADPKLSVNDSSKLLAEFFNGIVVQIDGEYAHEP